MSRRTMNILAILVLVVTLAIAALGWHYFSAPRTPFYQNEYAALSAAALDSGVISVSWRSKTATGRVRVGVQKDGGEQYLYELPTDGRFETLALTEGNGSYTVTVYQHIEGTRYRPVLTQELTLALADPNEPFLHPNQMVNYAGDRELDALSKSLTAGLGTDGDRLQALLEYVVTHYHYDQEWAEILQSGYAPVLADVRARNGGNCLDLAALLCAMLRLRGIPCQLSVGWAGGVYHAWINAFIGNSWQLCDPTFRIGAGENFVEAPETYDCIYSY